MRKYFGIIVIFLLLLLTDKNYSATASVIFIPVDCDEGKYDWVMNGMVTCFGNECKDCIILPDPTPIIVNLVQGPIGGWIISGELDYINFIHTNSPNENVKIYYNTGFVFDNTFLLRIMTCNEYPQLIGVTINLNGTTIVNQTNFNVFIP